MRHLSARLHALYHGLFRPQPRQLALELHHKVEALLRDHGLSSESDRSRLAHDMAGTALAAFDKDVATPGQKTLEGLILRVFNFEGMFLLPKFDWAGRHSVADYWQLQDELNRQKLWLDDFERTTQVFTLAICHCLAPVVSNAPRIPLSGANDDAITVPTDLVRAIADIDRVTEAVSLAVFGDEIEKLGLFARHRRQFEGNLIAASGGNPADPQGFSRAPKYPSQSDIKDPEELVATYLGRTPIADLFKGAIPFALPNAARFEHHHIVAGSGHGKTQTLQYLIAEDLAAVARGERSVIVIDSQGDLIRRISHLKQFAPGEALHDRIVIIDPADVEWPVSLNLFDIGLERLDRYSKLDRERLINSILELYDFVLGSLLSAEMTQKQNVIFRYVTRLMLHIPDATIHTLRQLMEPKSEVRFVSHIATLSGTARQFFETEFGSSEFVQTRKQVLRRLWGILENQTFERMFSHPRSKLDLFAEMNAGKVILINTAKDLLKETGTEIFGRFFIALIAQAAQERATLKEEDRMPTFVYIDEAADYFDRNIGIILSQARKYNVGMVLAHQYLGQLEPRLQEAFAANTSIKFAGGVSNRDARSLAPMMACAPEFIEAQSKGSFAAHVRGVTKSALPLKFPFGRMEAMARMTQPEYRELIGAMRKTYAVHYSELEKPAATQADSADGPVGHTPQGSDKAKPSGPRDDPDRPDTTAKPEW